MGRDFSTVQFARLCGVSKQTLIYYDRIGLFAPQSRDGRGYRRYGISQFDTFGVICLLAELGTPLEEIRTYLERKNSRDFLRLMEEKRETLAEKVRRLEETDRIIADRIALTKEAAGVDPERILLEERPEEEVVLTAAPRNQSDEEFARVISLEEQRNKARGIRSFGYGAVVDMEEYMESGVYRISCFLNRCEGPHPGKRTKPGGLYGVTFHKGSYETIERAYARLAAFIRREGLQIRGSAYEDVLLDAFSEEPEGFLTRIGVPLSRKSQGPEEGACWIKS